MGSAFPIKYQITLELTFDLLLSVRRLGSPRPLSIGRCSKKYFTASYWCQVQCQEKILPMPSKKVGYLWRRIYWMAPYYSYRLLSYAWIQERVVASSGDNPATLKIESLDSLDWTSTRRAIFLCFCSLPLTPSLSVAAAASRRRSWSVGIHLTFLCC